jgi:hypothetical protein
MLSPTDLHPELRPGWQLAEQVRAHLLETIRPVSANQWAFHPAEGSWCIGEVVEHLLRAEIGSSKMVRKLIRGDYGALEMPADAILYTQALEGYPYGRLEAPRELAPGQPQDRPTVERELGASHSRFRQELSGFRGHDPEALRSPDPATGAWFTLGGWVKLQAYHEAHHLAQIRRILIAPHFPR